MRFVAIRCRTEGQERVVYEESGVERMEMSLAERFWRKGGQEGIGVLMLVCQ